MKMGFAKLVASAVMVAMPVVGTVAATAPVVTAASVSGSAFVARDGMVVPLKAGQALRAGDRVMTRAGSSVKLSGSGCQRSVGATSVIAVGSSCAASVAGANLAQVGTYEDSEGTPFSHYIVGLLAAVAVGLGIYVAIDNNESDDAPVSI